MKNILRNTLVIILAATLSIGLSSCKKDGDESVPSNTWKGHEDDISLTINFKSKSTGTWSGTSRESRNKPADKGTFQCEWLDSERGYVTVMSDNYREYYAGRQDYPFVFCFVISGNKMTLFEDDYFCNPYYYDHDDYFELTRQ